MPSPVLIVLNRGTNGLGFNIRGGKDQPHLPNDTGIFVTKIRENGAAAADGTLQEGDKILEINGNSMEDLDHNDAVNLFLRAGEEVRLKILSGAERFFMESYAKECREKEINAQKKKRRVLTSVAVIVGVCCVVFYYRNDIVNGIKKLSK